MADGALERLRAESSRGDYPSMVRLARALYADGLGRREVLRRCYGVEFPEEFFVIAEADPWSLDLPAEFTNQPWNLAVPPSRGGPPPEPWGMDETERRLFARDPDLVPLLQLYNPDAKHGESVLCYRLSDLRDSRSATYGIWWRVEPGDEATHYGDSLLAVMHEHHTDAHRLLRLQNHHPSNLGAGSVDNEDVDEARAQLELIENLERKLTSRTG